MLDAFLEVPSRGKEMQMCNVQRCRGADVQLCRGAEMFSYRGEKVQRRRYRGAEKCMCRGAQVRPVKYLKP